jgi:phenylacetate-coenzyme A ligase PaaK-like adenylate-forming protein
VVLRDGHALALRALDRHPGAHDLREPVEDAGIHPKDLRLRVGFFGAEPWTEAMRAAIEARLDLMALSVSSASARCRA